MSENECIARAAGLGFWGSEREPDAKGMTVTYPDWRTDPGACATWLLPVLIQRFDALSFDFGGHETDALWSVSYVNDVIAFAPTWHEVVIAAILTGGPD